MPVAGFGSGTHRSQKAEKTQAWSERKNSAATIAASSQERALKPFLKNGGSDQEMDASQDR